MLPRTVIQKGLLRVHQGKMVGVRWEKELSPKIRVMLAPPSTKLSEAFVATTSDLAYSLESGISGPAG